MQIFRGKISSTVHDFVFMHLLSVLSIGLGFDCRSFFNGDLIKRNKGVNVIARNLSSVFHVIVADGRIIVYILLTLRQLSLIFDGLYSIDGTFPGLTLIYK